MGILLLHEGASPFAFNSRIALRSKTSRSRQKKGTLKAYCEVVHYLLERYSTDDVIAEIDAESMRFTAPLSKTAILYVEILCSRALRCDR